MPGPPGSRVLQEWAESVLDLAPETGPEDVREEAAMSLGRVLVVDDEPEVRQLLQEFLSGRGYEVLVAGDGMAALDALDIQRPDLVLLTLRLRT